jgi:hypothetical protein
LISSARSVLGSSSGLSEPPPCGETSFDMKCTPSTNLCPSARETFLTERHIHTVSHTMMSTKPSK